MYKNQLDEKDLKQSHFKIQQPLSRHLFLCHCTKQRQAIINAQFPTTKLVPAPFHAQEKEAQLIIVGWLVSEFQTGNSSITLQK